ncbi:hypothetical protein [Treponema sp. J25]|uniref:hypothetical protein n=1 Tax=Treponema sp. J25 TaxID=2094121 RepID=UPI00104F68D5|nr:hypothetical protein [Treponema sp. J25]TCW60763.1 hypothetical protein C5O22_09850 [Treponema sp. J25]
MKDSEKKEIPFYYSRARRLERAPLEVQRLMNSSNQGKPSLFKTLTASRSHAFLFLAIVILSLTIMVLTYLMPLR